MKRAKLKAQVAALKAELAHHYEMAAGHPGMCCGQCVSRYATLLRALEAQEAIDTHFDSCPTCCRCDCCDKTTVECTCVGAGCHCGRCDEYDRLTDDANDLRRAALSSARAAKRRNERSTA